MVQGSVMDPEQETGKYRELYPLYAKFTSKLDQLLKELLPKVVEDFAVESRPKDPEHFKEKIARSDKSYIDPIKEVTDLAGLRVILTHLSDVRKVEDLIEREFVVDPNSEYKIKRLEADQFGYLSDHIVVSLREDRTKLSDWSDFVGLRAEIQIRTNLQHAWALISRRFAYKLQTDIPQEHRRRLNRLSALFELADEELDHIVSELRSTSVAYKAAMTKGENKIDINVDSLKTYIETSPEVRYWNDFLRTDPEVGHKVDSWGDLSRDVRIAHFCGLRYIADIDSILRQAHGWGEEFFRRFYARMLREHPYVSNKGDIMTVLNGTVTMLMIAARAEEFTSSILDKDFGFGSTYLLETALDARRRK